MTTVITLASCSRSRNIALMSKSPKTLVLYSALSFFSSLHLLDLSIPEISHNAAKQSNEIADDAPVLLANTWL